MSRDTPSASAKCGQRGDWFFPTFNGEPRYHKPILIYWLMGLATAAWGDNPFGVRHGLVARRRRHRAGRLGARQANAGPQRRETGCARHGDGAAGRRRVEAGDDRRDAGASCSWAARPACGSWASGRRARPPACFWGLLALATLTKGPVGPALVAVVVDSGLVVGLARGRVEAAALAARTGRVSLC